MRLKVTLILDLITKATLSRDAGALQLLHGQLKRMEHFTRAPTIPLVVFTVLIKSILNLMIDRGIFHSKQHLLITDISLPRYYSHSSRMALDVAEVLLAIARAIEKELASPDDIESELLEIIERIEALHEFVYGEFNEKPEKITALIQAIRAVADDFRGVPLQIAAPRTPANVPQRPQNAPQRSERPTIPRSTENSCKRPTALAERPTASKTQPMRPLLLAGIGGIVLVGVVISILLVSR